MDHPFSKKFPHLFVVEWDFLSSSSGGHSVRVKADTEAQRQDLGNPLNSPIEKV